MCGSRSLDGSLTSNRKPSLAIYLSTTAKQLQNQEAFLLAREQSTHTSDRRELSEAIGTIIRVEGGGNSPLSHDPPESFGREYCLAEGRALWK